MKSLTLLILSATIGLSPMAMAADFYVRAGATGAKNGSNWTDAWTSPSAVDQSKLNPGDTVWIAGGTYGSFWVTRSGAAGAPITFKRATKAAHGTATGWQDAYDARVIIDGGGSDSPVINVTGNYASRSYITIDGATRYGIWIKGGYYGIQAAYGINNLTLRYLELGDAGSGRLKEDGLQGKGNDLLVEYCYLHDNDSGVTHGDNIQWFNGTNLTIRYNVFKNGGQMFMMGVKDWGDTVNNVSVYYNVFYNRGGGHYNGMVFDYQSPPSGGYINIYNNTFDLEAGSGDGFNSIFYPLTNIGAVNFKNNAVIYSNAQQVNNTTHSHNGYDNSGQYAVYYIPGTETGAVKSADLGFVNVGAADYHLTSTSPLIGKGTNVGLTRDFDGKTVPSTPSIGAFEAGSGSVPPQPVPLAPPSNTRVQEQ